MYIWLGLIATHPRVIEITAIYNSAWLSLIATHPRVLEITTIGTVTVYG